ncbi:MAG: hemolysin family protein [Candidatus Omnitrophica bacterium]|nr:hemolysin family protein [Candidatus Omnitrophota bacterium]
MLIILALMSFLFAASETSIIGLSRIRLRHMLSRGMKRARKIQVIITKLDKFIVGILVGNNFVNIAMSAILTGLFVYVFGYKWGILLATLTAALFIVVICDIIPKTIAIKNTERLALLLAPFMEVFLKIFNPVIVLFSWISNFIIKMLHIHSSKRSPLITEEELRLMVELGEDEGFLSAEEAKMLQRIFEFGDTKVSDVMLPKDKIIAVNITATPEEVLNTFVEEGHARLPVYSGSVNNIIGVIYARDLLYILRDKGLFVLQDLIRDVYFVSPQTQVNTVLKYFQENKIQIAIVADNNKRTLGLITLEDLLEEIVGEIEEKPGVSRIKKS